MENLLNNNHSAMRTTVETFIIEETAPLIYDNEQLDKWNEHVEKLGLKGQSQIVVKDKSPIPFMHLKQNLIEVFECLCPRKVDVTEYNATPIPVEILDLIALSVREKYFAEVQIWYDDKSPDPICIGKVMTYYTYNKSYNRIADGLTKEEAKAAKEGDPNVYNYSTNPATIYLLGKWADVKHSFATLTKMATDRYMQERGAEYKKTIKETQRKLDDLETEAFEKFGSNIKLKL